MIYPQEIIEEENLKYLEVASKDETIVLVLEIKNCIGKTKLIVSQNYNIMQEELQKTFLNERDINDLMFSDLEEIDYQADYSSHELRALKIKPFFPVFIYLHAIDLVDYNNSGIRSADAVLKFFFYPKDQKLLREQIRLDNCILFFLLNILIEMVKWKQLGYQRYELVFDQLLCQTQNACRFIRSVNYKLKLCTDQYLQALATCSDIESIQNCSIQQFLIKYDDQGLLAINQVDDTTQKLAIDKNLIQELIMKIMQQNSVNIVASLEAIAEIEEEFMWKGEALKRSFNVSFYYNDFEIQLINLQQPKRHSIWLVFVICTMILIFIILGLIWRRYKKLKELEYSITKTTNLNEEQEPKDKKTNQLQSYESFNTEA